MNWFLNFKTSTKIILIFGFMIIMMLCSITTAYVVIEKLRGNQSDIYTKDFSTIVNLMSLNTNLNMQRGSLFELMIKRNEIEKKEIYSEINKQ